LSLFRPAGPENPHSTEPFLRLSLISLPVTLRRSLSNAPVKNRAWGRRGTGEAGYLAALSIRPIGWADFRPCGTRPVAVIGRSFSAGAACPTVPGQTCVTRIFVSGVVVALCRVIWITAPFDVPYTPARQPTTGISNPVQEHPAPCRFITVPTARATR